MDKVYARINWENSPSTKTALGAVNLNRTDYAIDEIDNRVIKHDTEKADKAEILNLVNGWSIDEKTGVITVTKVNGDRMMFDLNIEKIPVDFSMSPDGILTMATADGTEFTANIGAMIPVLEFESTDTVAAAWQGEGVRKTYRFDVKDGSITEGKLRPDYLADIKAQTASASAAASASAESAKASQEHASNAKESEDSASESALSAQNSALAAGASESNAKRSEEAAEESALEASASEIKAKESEAAAGSSEENAAQSEENAAESAREASDKAKESSESAVLSKSWAVGGTGTRDGEDMDNSKYHAGQSKEYLNKVETAGKEAVESIENALGMVKPEFSINTENGHLYYTGGRFNFTINPETGHMEVDIVA